MSILLSILSRGSRMRHGIPPPAVLNFLSIIYFQLGRVSRIFAVFMFLICFCVFGIHCSEAGELKDDYAKIEIKRQQLEKQRSQYEVVLRALTARRISLNRALYQCISQKWDPSWEAELEEAKKIRETLETERLRLVNLRVTLDKVRMELEISRIETERRHQDKGPGSDYETEIRGYMDDIVSQYFVRLEKELFPGYKKYLSGIEKYFLFLKKTLDVCMRHKQAG